MSQYVEFIPKAGAAMMTHNVLNGAGRIKWMLRVPPKAPADNGWRIFSEIDTAEYLADTNNFEIVDYNELCGMEPALIGIWDLPIGSDLQMVIDEDGKHIFDTPTGRKIPLEEQYIPPQFRQ